MIDRRGRVLHHRKVRARGWAWAAAWPVAAALGAGCFGSATAQTSTRVEVPAEAEAAFVRREYGKSAGIVIPAFDACRAAHPQGDACADLAYATALLVATAGNKRTEETILGALAYIDAQVGRESEDALKTLISLSSYYNRMLDMKKFGPATERRYALSVKLKGPTAPITIVSAISLCVARWNLGRGQDAVDLLAPLLGKVPETTPAEIELSGRLYECTGTAYYSIDRNREAEGAFRRALALFERAGGAASETAIDAMTSLANTLRRLGRDGEARALAARVAGLAKPGSEVMARLDWAKGPTDDPIEAARQELARSEKQYGANSPVTDLTAALYGIALIDAGRFADAEPYLTRLAAAARNTSNPASVRIKLLTGQIAALATQDKGRFDRALPVIEQLVALAKQSGAGSDKLLIDFQMYAGVLLTAGGAPERGYPYLGDSGRLLLERIASYRDFDASAQQETRQYSPVFRYKVAAAWRLAQAR